MAKIKNTVDINVTQRGAQKAAQGIDQVTKAQTRQTNAGVSASRQFSAQATGLGGLVGAYAGAAANIFALQQAFDALRRAAQAETIIKGTKALALEVGASGTRILESVREITDGQLTLQEAAQNVNIALSAGFNTRQIERLTIVSEKASRALGRSLTDAMTRVTRGAAKMEPELLDELGIFTRIDPAVEKYAASLNVAASSLTNYQRRQAFVNAVIEEGEKKFSVISTSVPSSQKSIERLIVAITDLATEFGQLVANVLQPFVDFISDNAGVALLAFLAVLKLVFGQAGRLVGNFAVKTSNDVNKFADNLLQKAQLSKKAISEITTGARQEVGAGGLKGVQTKARYGRDPEQVARFAAAKEALTKGSIENAKQLKQANAALKEEAKLLPKNSKARAALTGMIAANNKALTGFGIRTTIATIGSTILTGAVTRLGAAFALLGTIVNSVFMIIAVGQLAGTLFGFDFLNTLKGLFMDLSAAAADFKAGLLGMASAAAGGAKDFETLLRFAGATKDMLTDADALVASANAQVAQGAAGAVRKRQGAAILDLEKAGETGDADKYAKANAAFKATTVTIQDYIKAAKDLAAAQDKSSEKGRVNAVIFTKLAEGYKRFGFAAQTVGVIAKDTGIETNRVAEIFEKYAKIATDGSIRLGILNFTLDESKKKFGDLSPELQQSIKSFVLLGNTIDSAEESFEKGSATSETLSKKLGGMRESLKELTEGMPDIGFSKEQRDSVEEFNKKIKETADRVKDLKQLETIGKGIADNYSSAFKALDNAIATGVVSGGTIAKNEDERAKNQAKFLHDQIIGEHRKAKEIKEAVKAQELLTSGAAKARVLTSREVELLKNRKAALKAMAGIQIKLTQDVAKELKATDKLRETQEKQNALLYARLDLEKKRRYEQRSIQDFERYVKLQEMDNELIKSSVKELSASTADHKEYYEGTKRIVELRKVELDLINKAADARQRQADTIQISQMDTNIAKLQNILADMEFFSGLSTEEDRRKIREQIINEEFRKELMIIGQKKRQNDIEFQRETKLIDAKEKQLKIDQKHQETMFNHTAAQHLHADRLLASEQHLEMARLHEEKRQLEAKKEMLKEEGAVSKAQFEIEKLRDKHIEAEALQRIEALEYQAKVVNQFSKAVGKDTPFVQAIKAMLTADQAKAFEAAAKSPEELKTDTTKIRGNLTESTRLRREAREARFGGRADDRFVRRQALQGDIAAQEQLIQATRERQHLDKSAEAIRQNTATNELLAAEEVLRLKLHNINAERDALNAADTARRAELQAETEAAFEAFEAKKDVLNRERNMVKQFASDISLAIGSELKNSLSGFFQAVADGNGVLDSARDAFQNFMLSIIETIQEKIGEKFIAPAIEGFVGNLFAASGGAVHLAGGGAMKRDRIPAMLEPGEFVIRKPMAKAIGGPALSAMNGHGKGFMPNIEVQVKNEGTPKDADAQVKPQIDVNKMVVEIVTRDIRNNGPIRKTLRTGTE